MKVNCPSCNQKYNIAESMYGQELQCQACNKPMVFLAPAKAVVKQQNSTKINCPSCNQKYSITESQYGQQINCQVCNEQISISAPVSAVDAFYTDKKKSSFSTVGAGIAATLLLGGGYFGFLHFNKNKTETVEIIDKQNEQSSQLDNIDSPAPAISSPKKSKPAKDSPSEKTSIAQINERLPDPKVKNEPEPKIKPKKDKPKEIEVEEIVNPEELTVVNNEYSASKHSQAFTEKVVPFFKKYCVQCHGPDKEKGSLRVDKLVANLDDEYTLDHLQNIVDEMTVENMPPEEEPQPDSQKMLEVINILTSIEKEVKELHTAGGGRPIRRLTRSEFANTAEDLLGIRPSNVEDLPDDLYVGHFETHAESLFLTDLHIDLYLQKSRELVRSFIRARNEKPGTKNIPTKYSSLLKRSIFGFVRSNAPSAGELTIRSHWWVKNPQNAGKISIGPTDENLSYIINGTKNKPQIIEFTINSAGEDITWNIKKTLTPSTKKAGLRKRDIKELDNITITESNLASVQEGIFDHPVVLGKIEYISNSKSQPYDFFAPFMSKGNQLSDSDARSILKKFATLAKRGRDVDPAFLSMLERLYKQGLDQGMTFWEAIEEPMAISLCSIDSILHFEDRNPSKKSRVVSGLELANRLSYMLWRSAPDKELINLGRTNKLLDPSIRSAQVKRMMNDPKFDRFMTDFNDHWLELPRQLEIAVNDKIYDKFDTSIKPHMRQETIAFMSHLIREDLSILNMIDSNFIMLNEPMAKHYGIPGVKGDHFRAVKRGNSPAHLARGGVLTHAGILMQGSSGDRTSIVERGAFIARKIINTPPAEPPPNVGELPHDEDTTKMTGAQLVKLHTNVAACANCHSKIDPLGVAFEEYDVTGQVRKEELRLNPIFDQLPKRKKRDPKNRTIAVELDTKGKLYDGQSFKGSTQLKKVLLSKRHSLAKGYVKALLTYTNGRKAGLTDETLVINILKETAGDNYPARTIIEKVANSDALLKF